MADLFGPGWAQRRSRHRGDGAAVRRVYRPGSSGPQQHKDPEVPAARRASGACARPIAPGSNLKREIW